jgi:hypothetical protein
VKSGNTAPDFAFAQAGLREAQTQGRIAGVPYDPAALVWTAWDLGIRDATAIWFAQVVGREIRIIDYYEAAGVDGPGQCLPITSGMRASRHLPDKAIFSRGSHENHRL